MENNTMFQNVINGVKKAFTDALVNAGLMPAPGSEGAQNSSQATIEAAIEAGLKPLNEGINSLVSEAVTAQMENITEQVRNAVADQMKELNLPTDQTEAVNALTNRLREVEQAIAEGAGSAGSGKNDPDVPVNATNHPGVKW